MNVLTEFDRGRIIEMWELGASIEEIARLIPCISKTVCKWIQRWQEKGQEGLIDQRKNNKRPRLLTAEEDHLLISQVDDNPFLAVSNVVHKLNLPFSDKTAR